MQREGRLKAPARSAQAPLRRLAEAEEAQRMPATDVCEHPEPRGRRAGTGAGSTHGVLQSNPSPAPLKPVDKQGNKTKLDSPAQAGLSTSLSALLLAMLHAQREKPGF